MTLLLPTRSNNIGFALDRRIYARWLASEIDRCSAARQVEKTIKPDQKKGG
jgi:hypothetical protein